MINARIIGRYTEEEDKIKHIWTGSGIEFRTNAPELCLQIFAEYDLHEIWVAVELNGARILRTMLLPGMNTIPVYKNMDPATPKTVRIIKDSQAFLDDDAHYMSVLKVTDLSGKDVTTEATPKKNIAIEFIGDSLTSGEGLIGASDDMDFAYCYTSFKGNYARLIADALDADYSIISQCGYGVVCGWNNDPAMNMPEVYKYADGKNTPYSFEKAFDYVVINLGTNDNGAFFQEPYRGFQIDLEMFISKTREFLKFVMDKNPSAHIIWTVGMCRIELEEVIKEEVTKLGSPRVSFVHLPSCDELDHGSRNHPGPLTHKEAANTLLEIIWNR